MMDSIFDRLTQKDPGQDVNEEKFGTETFEDEAVTTQSEQSDVDRTELRVREAVQELLRFGLLEESLKPNLYRNAVRSFNVLNNVLEPLDLLAELDDVRGLVYLKVMKSDVIDETEDEWSHTLVRKQRLNLEQSLLIALLRQYFVASEQEAGNGSSRAVVAVDELIPQMQVYLGELGSEARERTRMLNLLDQLKDHGLVTAPDKNDRVTIRPIISHLANPENLQVLLYSLKVRAQSQGEPMSEGSDV